MERVHATREKPISEMDAVAVGIYIDRNHVGILHKEDASISPIIRLLHHCWHAELQNTTDIAKCAFWVAPSFSTRLGKIVAGYCRLIHNRNLNKVIPYGFGDIEDAFDRLGALAGDASINGLTCATFVLAVFHRAGAAIADYSSWPVRESHSKIQSGLMDCLEGDDSIPREHIKKQREAIEKGERRFSPIEVAAAASAANRPASFSNTQSLVSELEREFYRVFGQN